MENGMGVLKWVVKASVESESAYSVPAGLPEAFQDQVMLWELVSTAWNWLGISARVKTGPEQVMGLSPYSFAAATQRDRAVLGVVVPWTK
jgi:hypothetical protein